MKEKFWQYILDNFTMESFDKEDTVNALLLLLDGIGIKKEEIEQFIDWN